MAKKTKKWDIHKSLSKRSAIPKQSRMQRTAFQKHAISPKQRAEQGRYPGTNYLPSYVSTFDKLIDINGLERGTTLLLSGGCGSGKSIFALQSAYNSALAGEKVVYFIFDDDPERVKRHMYNSFGWNFAELEKRGVFWMQRINPYDITRAIESIVKEKDIKDVLEGMKHVHADTEVTMPFHPDRVFVDSISALSVAFGSKMNYRAYLDVLFDSLRSYNSVNMVITESEQEPEVYSRSGIEEFLVDGVVVFYYIRRDSVRTRALEVLKLRYSDHVKKLVPFKITSKGIVIYLEEQVF